MLVLLAFLVLTLPTFSLMITSANGSSNHHENVARVLSGTPPQILFGPLDPTSGGWNTTFVFYYYLLDPDNDNLNVTWDWGDGTPIEVNYTTPAGPDVIEVMNTHVYAPPLVPGRTDYTFFLTFYADDGNGNNVSSVISVIVLMPANYGPVAPSAILPPGKVDPFNKVTIYTNSSDPEGDPLTWTYIFDPALTINATPVTTVVNHTLQSEPGALVWSNITVVFGAVGFYNITMYASDAPPPYDVFPHNLSRRVGPIQVTINQKPNATSEITVNPESPIINATLGYVDVSFSIDVSDPDGDPLNATWDFGDGTPLAYNESNKSGTNTFIQIRNYTNGGSFIISFNVTDGVPGHEVVVSQMLNVSSTNRPPSVLRFNFTYASLDYARVNETVNFTLVIYEPENDPISIIIDFGDNSSRLYLNLTEVVAYNETFPFVYNVTFNHTFKAVGNFTVKIWYTDNKIGVFNHTKEYNVTVKVKIPIIVIPDLWSWWDYTSLGLFCMIPVLVLLQFVVTSRRRKAIESEGMSVEEWKLRKSQGLDQELEKELELQKRGGS